MNLAPYLNLSRPDKLTAVIVDMVAQKWESAGGKNQTMDALKSACAAEDWSIIGEACAIVSGNDKAYFESWAVAYAAHIFNNPECFGLGLHPAKKDILDLMEMNAAGLYRVIPTSSRGRSAWWKRVDCQAEQARGYAEKKLKIALHYMEPD